LSGDAIRVTGVSKRFRIPLDRSSTLKYRLTHLRSSARYRNLLAINDVSFDVPRGQFLGITGPNGCGKSTLLKMLSRIYTPDVGKVEVMGRVSPFLELGVGFNPELSARDNIFLGGAVLGLTRKQLAVRVPRILEFAELEEFADQKLKNFSSGMGVRLAFAVAIQADADILLMDEVLAVGDARFQEKCFDVFAEYKRQNRTIVLVSHDLGSLNLYCDRVLLLQHGHLIADGPPDEVTSEYRRIVGAMSEDGAATGGATTGSARWGSREVEITEVRITDDRGQPHTVFPTGGSMRVEVDYVVNAPAADFVFGLGFRRSDGVSLAGPNTKTGGHMVQPAALGTRGTVTYAIDSLELLAGSYQVTAVVYNSYLNHAFDHIEDAVAFRVLDDKGRIGMVDLRGEWGESRRPA
jgi:ABC-type polysaccharide/polyol phosphate transport system ATPase subunit